MSSIAPLRLLSIARERLLPCLRPEAGSAVKNFPRTRRYASCIAANSTRPQLGNGLQRLPMGLPQKLQASDMVKRRNVSAMSGRALVHKTPKPYRAYIALGSNVGNRLEMIERACEALRKDCDISLMRTSCLYETEPMYVQDQAQFLNGACEVCLHMSGSCLEYVA